MVVSHAMPPANTPDVLEWLTAGDGHRIPFRHWPVANARAVVHIVHGMAEHSGCYADVAQAFNAAGYAVLAHDHRCHGQAVSDGALGNTSMQQNWAGVLADMAVVNTAVRELHPELPLILLGHSMGSFIAQDFAQNHPDRLNLLLLEGSSYEAPWFTRIAGLIGRLETWRQGDQGRSRIIDSLSFGGFNKVFKNPRTAFDWLSRDTAFVDAYCADPLCGFQLSNGYWRDFVQGLNALYQPEAMRRIRSDLPIYLFAGDQDPVGHKGRGVVRLAQAYQTVVGSRDVTLRLYPEARHDVLHETNRDEVMIDLLGWIGRHLPEAA